MTSGHEVVAIIALGMGLMFWITDHASPTSRSLALFLGLAAQVPDVHLERVGRGGEVVAPDLLEDEAAVEHSPRSPQEHLQQGELGAGELDVAGAAQHLAGGDVHGEVGEGEHLLLGAVLGRDDPAQQGTEPGEETPIIEPGEEPATAEPATAPADETVSAEAPATEAAPAEAPAAAAEAWPSFVKYPPHDVLRAP